MSRSRSWGLVLAIAAVLAAAPSAASQEPGPPALGRDQVHRHEGRPWLRRLERVRRERMARFVGLDSLVAERVDEELRAFRQRHAQLRLERSEILAEMSRALADSITVAATAPAERDARLQQNLEDLRRIDVERRDAIERLRESLSRDLTVEQRARLQLFAERFQHQLEEQARRIRDRRHGREDRGPPIRRPPAARGAR